MKESKAIGLLIFLLLFSILPSLFFVIFKLPSLTIGFSVSILIFCVVIIIKYPFIKLNKKLVFFLFLSILFLFLFSFTNLFSSEKVLYSIYVVVIFVVACIFLSSLFISARAVVCQNVFVKTALLLSSLGWLSFFIKFKFLGFDYYLKSVFTFYEPSHFAVVFGVFFVASICFDISNKLKGYLFLSALLFGLFLPNATMLVYCLIATTLMLRNMVSYFFIIGVIILMVAFFTFVQPELLVYYADRVLLTESNNNLSALVYLQGWHEAYASLIETNGLGLGFQMAGTNLPSEMAQKIHSIAGVYLNREDGSFLAAKLIIEFGIFGLLIVLSYLFLLFSSFSSIRNGIYNAGDFKLLLDSITVSFFCDMFIRSAGYFTLGFFIFFTSIVLRFHRGLSHVK